MAETMDEVADTRGDNPLLNDEDEDEDEDEESVPISSSLL